MREREHYDLINGVKFEGGKAVVPKNGETTSFLAWQVFGEQKKKIGLIGCNKSILLEREKESAKF